ncbi:MAG: histone deacetylase [Flavobacteriales bacterium]
MGFIAWSDIYAHPLPEGHRFPMLKYELIPEQLLYEGTFYETDFLRPEVMISSIITSVHTPEYLKKLETLSLNKSEERKTGFPLSEQLIQREKIIMQGTLDAALAALRTGVGFNVAGGTHHAYADRGEGFCLLNDQALAAQYLLDKHIKSRILIIDLDVHQGNGTAAIFSNEPNVFTFSMHGANNYPLHKEKSDLDIPLSDGISDREYLSLLDTHLKQTFDLFQPDFLFYQCGVDILETDKLGRLKVTPEGCKKRDALVFDIAKNNSIPIVCSMGGGYSEDIRKIVDAHCTTFRLAAERYF